MGGMGRLISGNIYPGGLPSDMCTPSVSQVVTKDELALLWETSPRLMCIRRRLRAMRRRALPKGYVEDVTMT